MTSPTSGVLCAIRGEGTLTDEEFKQAKSVLLGSSAPQVVTVTTSASNPNAGPQQPDAAAAALATAIAGTYSQRVVPRMPATAADYMLELIFGADAALRQPLNLRLFPGDEMNDDDFVAVRQQLDRLAARAVGQACPMSECHRLMEEASQVVAAAQYARDGGATSAATRLLRRVAPSQITAAVRHTCVFELGLADIPRGVRLVVPQNPISASQLFESVGGYFEQLSCLVHDDPALERVRARALVLAALDSATVSLRGAQYVQGVVAALAEFVRLSSAGQQKTSADVHRIASIVCGATPMPDGVVASTGGQSIQIGAGNTLSTWAAWSVIRAQLESAGALRRDGFLRALARLEYGEMEAMIDNLCRVLAVDPEAYLSAPTGAAMLRGGRVRYSGAEYGAAVAAMVRLFGISRPQLFSVSEWVFFAGGVDGHGPPLPPIVEHAFFEQLAVVAQQFYLLQRTWKAKSAVLDAEAKRLRTRLLTDSKMDELSRSLCESLRPGQRESQCIEICLGAAYRPSAVGLQTPIPPSVVLRGVANLLNYLGVSPALVGRDNGAVDRRTVEDEDEAIDTLKPYVYWLGTEIDELMTSVVTVREMHNILSDTLATVELALNLPFFGDE